MWFLDKLFPRKRLPDLLPWDLAVDDRTVFTKLGGFLQVAHVVARDLELSSGRRSTPTTTRSQRSRASSTTAGRCSTISGAAARRESGAVRLRRKSGAQLIDGPSGGSSPATAPSTTRCSSRSTTSPTIPSRPDGLPSRRRQGVLALGDVRRFRDDASNFFGGLALLMPKVTLLEGRRSARTSPRPSTPRRRLRFHPVGLHQRGARVVDWRTGIKPHDQRQAHQDGRALLDRRADRGHRPALHGFDFECRWTVRIDTTAKHRQTKWLSKMRAEYEQRRQSMARRMIQHFMRREEPDTNPAAGLQVLEVDQLKADVELGDRGFAPITMTVRVWDEDPRSLTSARSTSSWR